MVARNAARKNTSKIPSNDSQLSLFENFQDLKPLETELAEMQFDQRPEANTEEYKARIRALVLRAIKTLD